jgi:hypothetical protein
MRVLSAGLVSSQLLQRTVLRVSTRETADRRDGLTAYTGPA